MNTTRTTHFGLPSRSPFSDEQQDWMRAHLHQLRLERSQLGHKTTRDLLAAASAFCRVFAVKSGPERLTTYNVSQMFVLRGAHFDGDSGRNPLVSRPSAARLHPEDSESGPDDACPDRQTRKGMISPLTAIN